MARPHWEKCIAHFDAAVGTFISDYFNNIERHCFLVAAAGFDPRSRQITTLLADVLDDRLQAIFLREERGTPDADLVAAANENADRLRELVPASEVVAIEIFGTDNAPVAGARVGSIIGGLEIPEHVTDVILDLTALSIGIGFPAAKVLLEACEATENLAFHIMIASNPELDDQIASEPGDRPMAIRGFSGAFPSDPSLEVAKMWIPQLAKGRSAALDDIGRSIGETYKICPVLPFPARNPRRADALIAEYQEHIIDEWRSDPRDIVYVSEHNPLDCYRTLSTLKARYDQTVEGIFEPSIVLSPIGSKVMAAGALMAAIEHDMRVEYVETVRYEYDHAISSNPAMPDLVVHLLLSGPAYGALDTHREGGDP